MKQNYYIHKVGNIWTYYNGGKLTVFLGMAKLTCLTRQKETRTIINNWKSFMEFYCWKWKNWTGDLWVLWLESIKYGKNGIRI